MLGCPKSVFLSKKCVLSAPSYKRETKSVKCRGVYLNKIDGT